MPNISIRLPFGLTGSCVVALALAAGPALAQVPQGVQITVRDLPQQPAEPQAVPGEIIVKMRPGVAAERALPASDLVALGVRSAPIESPGSARRSRIQRPRPARRVSSARLCSLSWTSHAGARTTRPGAARAPVR